MNLSITEVNAIFIKINMLISYQNFSVSIFSKCSVQYVISEFKIHIMLVYVLGSDEMYYNFPINSSSR